MVTVSTEKKLVEAGSLNCYSLFDFSYLPRRLQNFKYDI